MWLFKIYKHRHTHTHTHTHTNHTIWLYVWMPRKSHISRDLLNCYPTGTNGQDIYFCSSFEWPAPQEITCWHTTISWKRCPISKAYRHDVQDFWWNKTCGKKNWRQGQKQLWTLNEHIKHIWIHLMYVSLSAFKFLRSNFLGDQLHL